MGDESAQRGSGGRPAGTPSRDRAELRALLQERVHEFTELRQKQDLAELEQQGIPPEDAILSGKVQQVVEDYDPVVALAIVAVDRRSTLDQRIKCNAEVAQYVRPKLKSVEMQVDPEALETLEERRQLSAHLVGLLEAAAASKKKEAPRKYQNPPPPSSGDE